MLNFDEGRYVAIQGGAVAQTEEIHHVISKAVIGGARNLFFLGTGGAGLLMEPAAQLLRDRSTFATFHVRPAELVHSGSRHLGPGSLVVIPSLSGTTAESLEVLRYSRARGATVLGLTGHADSPIAQEADHSIVNFAEDDTSCESFYLQSLVVALSVMEAHGESDATVDLAGVLTQLRELPSLLLEVKRAFEPRAAELAAAIAAEPYHVVCGAGGTWPEAHYYGMCILEEMQWIRTRPVHASDFFHGTLELLEPGVSLLLLKGEDECRPLVDRVEAFAAGRTDLLTVLDSADLALPGISQDVRALLSPVLLASVLERVSAHLEVLRDHPLTTRRYYKRVAY